MSFEYPLLLYLFCSIVVFCSTRKHLLLSLLSLEFIVLGVFMSMFFSMMIYGYEVYFSMVFLIFTVSEGALGLAILVKLVRSQGNDFLSSMSVLVW
nr:NADH dehydrogenase subunit 4L [Aeschrocoris ceylonicus]